MSESVIDSDGLPPKTYPDVPGQDYAVARQDGLWLSSDGKTWRKAQIH